MKKIIKNICIIMIVFLLICNYIFPKFVYAETEGPWFRNNGNGTISLMADSNVVCTVAGEMDASGNLTSMSEDSYYELLCKATDYTIKWEIADMLKAGNTPQQIARTMVFYYMEWEGDRDGNTFAIGGGSMAPTIRDGTCSLLSKILWTARSSSNNTNSCRKS